MTPPRIAPVPPHMTGATREWAEGVARVLNSTPSLSYFSGATPESVVTALPGHLLINVASGSSSARAYIKGGAPASGPNATGWVPLSSGGVTTVAAAMVSAGTFGASVGGGDYVFPAALTVTTTLTAATFVGALQKTLTFGTHLTGTSFNNSADVTLATDATSANTASTIVARDASGNFTAGTITAALSGNATTATTLTTTRTIWGQNFNGSANVSGALSGATTIDNSGLITSGGGITVTGGTFATGKIYKSSGIGLTLGAITGSTYDFAVYTPSGANEIIAVPTGTTNVTIGPGSGGTLTVASNITQTSGTAALQAVTATTGLFTGAVTSSASRSFTSTLTSGEVLYNTSATTSFIYMRFQNTGGGFLFGIEASSGGNLATGSSAYATVLNSNSTYQLATSGTVRWAMDTGGAVTNSGTLNVVDNFTVNTNKFSVTASSGAFSAGRLTSTEGNNGTIINSPVIATTGALQLAIIQTTGAYLGVAVESSTGGSITTGSSAYASIFGTFANVPTEFFTNNAVRYSISGAGAHDFKSGAATFGANITQTAGTASLQAITGTTYVGSSTLSATDITASGVLSSTAGGTHGVGTGLTTANTTTVWTIQSGTHSGANDKNASLFYNRGATTLWEIGVLGTVATDGAMRWYDSVGAAVAASLTAAGVYTTLSSHFAGAATEIGWTGRATMKSSADGIIELFNDALSGFTRLNFGGTSSSFPALKRSSATLQARLADDSAFAELAAADFTLPAGGKVYFRGSGSDEYITSPGNNILDFAANGSVFLQIDPAGATGVIRLYTLEAGNQFVSAGAADSGGTGYRVLLVPNS